MKHERLGTVLASTLLAACSQGHPAPDSPGHKLDIRVAPLTLNDVVDACYGLQVLNEQLETVWSQPSVCANQYGDLATDISYVGPCDASDPNNDGTADTTVVLTIAALYGPDSNDPGSDPDPLDDFRNPCAAPYAVAGCRLLTSCRENADVLVEFNLTVMREANQGFFDIAVNFDDIFCSAKVDCAYPASGDQPARPIELVFDPATGGRVQTVVWAFACTDGDPGTTTANATHLYMDDLVLRCGETTYTVSPSAGPGNLYPNGVGAPAPLVQAMVFEGEEVITNGGLDADKLYWNVALGLKRSFFAPESPALAPTCVLETRATASRGPLNDGTTPSNTNYPYVNVSVPINSGATITCTQHGLDQPAPHGGVSTAYTGTRTDGSGFASATFAHGAAPSASGILTNPVDTLVDECLANPCSVNASCQDRTAGFLCTCNAGYSGNGLVCNDIDGCTEAPCFDGVTCTDVTAPGLGRTCGPCPAGMSGDGATCIDIDDCDPEPCQHGTCTDNGVNSYTCDCDPGWQGTHCDVAEPTTGGFISLAAGYYFACGVRTSGALVCWGSSSYGVLGQDLGGLPQPEPLQVGTNTNWSKVVTATYHACALNTAGEIYCWGINGSGQLGLGDTNNRTTPTKVSGTWADVYANGSGNLNTCAKAIDGTLWCWGANNQSQLGIGNSVPYVTSPTQVSGAVDDWAQVSIAGSHVCGVTDSQRMYCWGSNSQGSLGMPRAAGGNCEFWWDETECLANGCGYAGSCESCSNAWDSSSCESYYTGCSWDSGSEVCVSAMGSGGVSKLDVPTAVDLAADWVDVATGNTATCALKSDGTRWCWGQDQDEMGTLAVPAYAVVDTPTQVDTRTDWADLELAQNRGCGRVDGGALFCWGRNEYYQAGDGTTNVRETPTLVLGGHTDWGLIAVSHEFTCATGLNALRCWGRNDSGQAAIGVSGRKPVPTRIGNSTDWLDLSLGDRHMCALKQAQAPGTATLWCAGQGWDGQLGIGGTDHAQLLTQESTGRTDWVGVGAGPRSTQGITATGQRLGTGRDWSGGLGNNGATGHLTSFVVMDTETWDLVDVGGGNGDHGCGIRDTELYCWGENYVGEVGNNSTVDQPAPVRIGTATGWTDIALSGAARSYGLRGGELYGWGSNANGILGIGTASPAITVPTRIGTEANWDHVAAGRLHTCGVRTDGTLWCWGYNYDGQLGNGSRYDTSMAPSQVGNETDWAFVATGGDHSCALKVSGALWCWGKNYIYNLGDGTTEERRLSPVRIGTDTDWALIVGSLSEGFTCGLRVDGSLWCWGENSFGQHGDGSAWVTTPTAVP